MGAGPVVVGRYREEDREGVIALWRELFPGNGKRHDPVVSLEKKLAERDGLLFVARVDGRVVGTVLAGYDGHRGWLHSVGVDAGQRGKGIGNAMIEAAEAGLMARGCLKINLQIMGDNKSVVGFYERLGYAVEDRVSMGKVVE